MSQPPREVTIPAPTVGRLVHYHIDMGQGQLELVPAVITFVFHGNKNGMVNLKVLTNDPRPAYWATSVFYGYGHNMWSWPPMSKEEVTIVQIA